MTTSTRWIYLQRLNHSPLDQGDNLPRRARCRRSRRPHELSRPGGASRPGETLSSNWTDPTVQVNDYYDGVNGQPNGLHPRPADSVRYGSDFRVQADGNLLPPMTLSANVNGASYPVRLIEQPFTDGWGRDGAQNNVSPFWNPAFWSATWEDDLIATGVRSFDVKAYDVSIGQYVDLGWGDDLRFAPQFGVVPLNNGIAALPLRQL